IEAEAAGEGLLGVGVPRAERIGDLPGRTLALELLAVVVTPTRPRARPRPMIPLQECACLPEFDAALDFGLGQPGQLSAERTDHRAGGADEHTVPGHPPPRLHVHDAQADFDDLADLTGRRRPLPASRFHIDDVEELAKTLHSHAWRPVCAPPRDYRGSDWKLAKPPSGGIRPQDFRREPLSLPNNP